MILRIFALLLLSSAFSFRFYSYRSLAKARRAIVSPFESSGSSPISTQKGQDLELSLHNVETVLDELRPALIDHGGNVKLLGIDGTKVSVELEGACAGCSSSQLTFQLGIEKRLKEVFPQVTEIIQASDGGGPALTMENINDVLSEVNGMLEFVGGKVEIVSLLNDGHFMPRIELKFEGPGSNLASVRYDVITRIQKHFKRSLQIDFTDF